MTFLGRRGGGAGRLRKQIESQMRHLRPLADDYAGASADGRLDLAGFAVRAFELAPSDDIDHLVTHGIDGREFFLTELRPNWHGLTREQRAARIASFVRFANLLAREDGHAAESERLTELRATVRTKIVLLACAYDAEYDDSYCRRIARNPQRFGDYELTPA
jgi:hypothetical protein